MILNIFEEVKVYRQMLDEKTDELKQEMYQQFKTVIDDAFKKYRQNIILESLIC